MIASESTRSHLIKATPLASPQLNQLNPANPLCPAPARLQQPRQARRDFMLRPPAPLRRAAPIVSSRLGVGVAALLVSVVWLALLGTVVEATCNAGNYSTSSGTCLQCEAGFYCAAGSFNSRGGVLTLIAGSNTLGFADGLGSSAAFSSIQCIALDLNGSMYAISDGSRLRKVVIASGIVSTVAGSVGNYGSLDGIGSNATLAHPRAIAADTGSGSVFVTESHLGCRIRQIVVATGRVTTLAGSSTCGFADGVGSLAMFNYPKGIVSDQNGNLFVADTSNCRIRQVSISTGLVSTLAGIPSPKGDGAGCSSGDGVGTAAGFYFPDAVVTDMHGSLFVSQPSGFCRIRKIVIASKIVSTFAGSACSASSIDGVGTNAGFISGNMVAMAADLFGNLFVSDQQNRIRQISIATANVTTFPYVGSTVASTLAAGLGVLFAVDSLPRIFQLQAVSSCKPGFYCPAGSSSATQAVCSGGYFCGAGSSTATQYSCAGGVYCPASSTVATGAGPCSAGYYCPSGSSSATQTVCGLGTFCPSGSSAPTPCTAGAHCNATGLSAVSGICTGKADCPKRGNFNFLFD